MDSRKDTRAKLAKSTEGVDEAPLSDPVGDFLNEQRRHLPPRRPLEIEVAAGGPADRLFRALAHSEAYLDVEADDLRKVAQADALALTIEKGQRVGVLGPLVAPPPIAKKKIELTPHERRIHEVIQMGLKRLAYCRELDRRKILPRKDWLKLGCPSKYAAAYLKPLWSKRIRQEKYRITQKAGRGD